MKYVIFRCAGHPTKTGDTLERLVPIIFPDFMVHAHVEEVMRAVLIRVHGFASVTARSAGEWHSMSGETSGKSATLDLESMEGDDVVIRMYDYLHGIT